MSSFRHHRRHHSWPHCGSELCMREPRSLEVRVSRQPLAPTSHPAWSFQQATVVPLIAEELPNDNDAEKAGIVQSQASRAHRLWSRPLSKERCEDIPVSTSAAEARKHVHRSVLRRLIRRPPLDKTRSLFVMPTTMTAGDQVLISGWMPPRLSARPVMVTDKTHSDWSVADSAQFGAERRHRRSHSEQPRSWRKPSAGLWTLEEE
ncbi:uncharacterized protein N7459_001455 [Penicillium hispanicum]|uniref:uncharacterized protein n=1 Tax=Penicillium hispanicum TaxID=1080232 RepID=UPI00253FDD85|nr:uncharacterized protein N7459_001455 [Penicillium hispanicum]KAJ5595247.1 hypothetical protein N7459_001455 [Penicillium hispanicum]